MQIIGVLKCPHINSKMKLKLYTGKRVKYNVTITYPISTCGILPEDDKNVSIV